MAHKRIDMDTMDVDIDMFLAYTLGAFFQDIFLIIMADIGLMNVFMHYILVCHIFLYLNAR